MNDGNPGPFAYFPGQVAPRGVSGAPGHRELPEGVIERNSEAAQRGHAPSSAVLAELSLRACAAGAPCGRLALALAESVLTDAAARLAAEELRGGAYVHARAVDLAERVLQNAEAKDSEREGGPRG